MTGEKKETLHSTTCHYFFSIQFSLRDWNATLSIPISSEVTPTSEDTPTSGGHEEVVLVYVTVFSVLLLACVMVVVVILLLKYVQTTRRDTDKGQ